MPRRTTVAILVLLWLAVAPGCSNAPAGDPETSLDRYLSCAAKRKWNCMIALLPPDIQAKKGKTIGPTISKGWDDKLSYDYTIIQTSVAGDFATIQIESDYTWQGMDARDIHTEKDEYGSYALQQIGGVWYVIPPMLQKVQAF